MLSSELNLSTLSKIFVDETDEKARVFVESLLWPNGTVCPHCGSVGTAYKMTVQGKQTPNQKLNNKPAPYRTLYKCKDCRKPFTVRVGTIFEDSHIALRHWVMTFHLMTSSKKGVSSHQIAREVGVTVKSAWFMTHRIREAMTNDTTTSVEAALSPLGIRLLAIRKRIVESGVPLLDWDGVAAEKAKMRKGR